LAEHPDRFFAIRPLDHHLDRLGISALKVNPIPSRSPRGRPCGAASGAWLFCQHVIVSDDAGQFNVGQPACAGFMRTPRHKLDTFTDEHRIAQRRIRSLIWRFYRDLQSLSPASNQQRKRLAGTLRSLFTRKTGFVISRPPASRSMQQGELLMVLDRPRFRPHQRSETTSAASD